MSAAGSDSRAGARGLAGATVRARLRLRIVVAALRASGARALLAIAAVGLGVAATTITLALSAGAERELESLSARVGRDLFQIVAGQALAAPGRGRGWLLSTRLDRDDATLLAAHGTDVAAVAPVVDASRRAVRGREAVVTNVRGVTPAYLELRRFEIATGRALDELDEAARSRVALVGSAVTAKLAPGGSLVGATIRIGRVPFEVVGELAEKGMSPDGQNEDDQILVPLETARWRLDHRESLSRIVVQAASAARVGAAEGAARELLRFTHRLDPAAKDDFVIATMLRTSEIRARSLAFQQGLSRLFAITTLSLATAGVLLVTLLNVRERTGEIGLRRAVGARRRDVAALFLGEAVALAAAGGAAGLALGALAVAALESGLGWRMAFAPRALLIPFGLATAIGVASGVAPAWLASRRTPVEALRDR